MSARYIPLKDRFDSKWHVDPCSGCWIWTGALHKHGYGKMFMDGRLRTAHRIGWELYVGELPAELVIDHKCQRKNCVNPSHLELVTVAENTRRRNECGHSYDRLPTLRPPRQPKPTLRQRFDSKWKLAESGCWEWQTALNRGGYGVISVEAYPRLAHRMGHELYKGEIPAGLHIDHLCRNRRCVNPDHLESVTLQENARRGIAGKLATARNLAKTHCKRGHPLNGENLIQTARQRICRECRMLRKRGYNRINGPGRNLEGLKLGTFIQAEMKRAKTHCKRAHEFSPENTGTQSGKWRYCRKCDAMRSANSINEVA